MDGYSGGTGRGTCPLQSSSIIGVRGVNGIVSPKFVVFVSHVEQVFLCLRFLRLHGGTYSPPQTLLLDLSGPLGGEGKATWRGEEGRRRKEKEREG